jgi:hypothetical protein
MNFGIIHIEGIWGNELKYGIGMVWYGWKGSPMKNKIKLKLLILDYNSTTKHL